MIWDSRTVYTVWGYRPITRPAIKWHRVSNGDWRGSDRGIGEDVFEASVTFRGPIAELTDLETTLGNNRDEFLVTCGTGEEIFGADLDYSSQLTIAVLEYGPIEQVAFKTFQMVLKVRLVSVPVFVSDSPSLATLRKTTHSDTRESEFDMIKNFTYDRFGYVADHLSDPGTYKANFTQKTDEMKAIRRFLLTAGSGRAETLVFPSFDNMSYPFGTRAGTGPFNVKIINWADGGRQNLCDWSLSITFGREF